MRLLSHWVLLMILILVRAAGAQDSGEFRYQRLRNEPRMTLLQWSYGTSFSGGAPGPDEPLARPAAIAALQNAKAKTPLEWRWQTCLCISLHVFRIE